MVFDRENTLKSSSLLINDFAPIGRSVHDGCTQLSLIVSIVRLFLCSSLRCDSKTMLLSKQADCEIRSVIRFLNAKNVRLCDIHRCILQVYGEGVMNIQNARKWCRLFTEGRTEVHDAPRFGRSSVVDDLTDRIDTFIRQDRRVTIYEIHEHFPQISKSLIHVA